MTCQKCNAQFGIMVEEENSILCVTCHPTAISNTIKFLDVVEKFKQFDFKKVREAKYEMDN